MLSVTCSAGRTSTQWGILHRILPNRYCSARSAWLPLAAPAIILASILGIKGESGYQGDAADDWAEDYWKKNTATWTDFRMPSVSHVTSTSTSSRASGPSPVKGEYTFLNHRDHAYEKIPVTAGPWDPIEWTMGGEAYEPDDRANLFVFTPGEPLGPGDSLTIGFSYDFVFMEGMSKRPEGAGQFILESGIVLTAFDPTFARFPATCRGSAWTTTTRPSRATTRTTSTWARRSPSLAGAARRSPCARGSPRPWSTLPTGRPAGQRRGCRRAPHRVWETEQPVSLFNVVAGKYAVIEGDGTAIYHHPRHEYNVEEMSAALDAARRYYSEWFYPFPVNLLKISEFPAYAGYAQGFPTNITFSEGIGFPGQERPAVPCGLHGGGARGSAPVVGQPAHAGRWSGGQYPLGGDVALRHEAPARAGVRRPLPHGVRQADRGIVRRPALRRLGARHGQDDGSRSGDGTVTYDKGGWVMWMLQQEMGRDNILAGLRAFIAKYNPDPDHPVIQDMLAVLRGFAPDTTGFDDFAAQWFHDVVVPEYEFSNVTKTREGEEWVVRGTVENVGTGWMRVEVGGGSQGRGGRMRATMRAGRWWRRGTGRADGVELGGGEAAGFVIRAGFEPERVVIDPDVLVLQLNREAAVFEW